MSRRARLANPRALNASGYARAGYKIVPIFEPTDEGCSCGNAACTRAGKHPRTKHGIHDATSDATVVEAWWLRWPDANIAIATGHPSNIFVLDVDGLEGIASLATFGAKLDDFPPRAIVETGRGCHIYFRLDDAEISNSYQRALITTDAPGRAGQWT